MACGACSDATEVVDMEYGSWVAMWGAADARREPCDGPFSLCLLSAYRGVPAATSRHDKPTMLPSASMAIRSAAGSRGSPGMVMISPACATMNPAPADGRTSLTVMRKPDGRPRRVASSVNEYCVLAMQMGVWPSPMDSR